MRVVYLADAPYVHTRRWVEHFAAAGWETHVVSFRDADIPNVQVHHIDGWERLGKLRYLLAARRVRRLAQSLQPDLVHALHLTSYGFLAGLCDVRPTLTSVWGIDVLRAPSRSPLHYLLTRHALSRADHVTATGLRLASATLRYAPPAKPVTVVPYGVDLARFRPPSRNGARPAELVVGSVARLSPEKGLDILLRAAGRLLDAGSPVRVLLAGDGPERGRLGQLAGRLGIERSVEFRGEVTHDLVPSVLGEMDIFALPSRAEGFGVAALEAQAMELPVVASRVDGIPDVVEDGQTGLLVAPNDPAALAEAIGRLAPDAALREEMGRAGRDFVERRYRWQDNVAQMEGLYRYLLDTFTPSGVRATVPESQP